MCVCVFLLLSASIVANIVGAVVLLGARELEPSSHEVNGKKEPMPGFGTGTARTTIKKVAI